MQARSKSNYSLAILMMFRVQRDLPRVHGHIGWIFADAAKVEAYLIELVLTPTLIIVVARHLHYLLHFLN
jgi:hypothetical protein